MIVIVSSVLLVYLFQENKSYGSKKPFAFISSSDVWEVVLGICIALWFQTGTAGIYAKQLKNKCIDI